MKASNCYGYYYYYYGYLTVLVTMA